MPRRFDPDAAVTGEEDGEVQDLLAEFGLAVIHAQTVEFMLVNLLTWSAVRDKRELGSGTVREMMDTRYSQTMGKLVRDALVGVDLAEQEQRLIRRALQARNWLAHNYFRTYGPAAFDAGMRREAIQVARRARELFETTQDALHARLSIVLEGIGISQDEAEAGADEAIARAIEGKAAAPDWVNSE